MSLPGASREAGMVKPVELPGDGAVDTEHERGASGKRPQRHYRDDSDSDEEDMGEREDMLQPTAAGRAVSDSPEAGDDREDSSSPHPEPQPWPSVQPSEAPVSPSAAPAKHSSGSLSTSEQQEAQSNGQNDGHDPGDGHGRASARDRPRGDSIDAVDALLMASGELQGPGDIASPADTRADLPSHSQLADAPRPRRTIRMAGSRGHASSPGAGPRLAASPSDGYQHRSAVARAQAERAMAYGSPPSQRMRDEQAFARAEEEARRKEAAILQDIEQSRPRPRTQSQAAAAAAETGAAADPTSAGSTPSRLAGWDGGESRGASGPGSTAHEGA